mmetsp:Transcript_13707/g.26150  ORF Transcript_13707/g.26150 Transcript_13707/m.26150 type:complete len:293 (-) Transcript_13707:53-931(-)
MTMQEMYVSRGICPSKCRETARQVCLFLRDFVLWIIKIIRYTQILVCFLLHQTPLLHQIILRRKDIIRPPVRRTCHQRQLPFQIRNLPRVVLLQLLQLDIRRRQTFRQLDPTRHLLRTLAALVLLPTALRVGEPCLGLLYANFDGFYFLLVIFVCEFVETVFFGGEGPEVVGPTDFFLVDESVVDEGLVDVGNGILVHPRLRCQRNDFLFRVNLLGAMINSQDGLTLLICGHTFGFPGHDYDSMELLVLTGQLRRVQRFYSGRNGFYEEGRGVAAGSLGCRAPPRCAAIIVF